MDISDVIFLILAMIAFIFLIFIILQMYRENKSGETVTGSMPANSYIQRVVNQLNKRKCVLYSMKGCPWCKKQKDLFGTEIHRLKYKEFDKNNISKAKDIEGFPAWKCGDGQTYSGYLDLSKLVEIFRLDVY